MGDVPFTRFGPLMVVIVSKLIYFVLDGFVSGATATTLLVPVLAMMYSKVNSGLASVKKARAVLVNMTMTTSYTVSLPVSAPPGTVTCSANLVRRASVIGTNLAINMLDVMVNCTMLVAFYHLNFVWGECFGGCWVSTLRGGLIFVLRYLLFAMALRP